jgi:hypothetical protein
MMRTPYARYRTTTSPSGQLCVYEGFIPFARPYIKHGGWRLLRQCLKYWLEGLCEHRAGSITSAR